MNAALNGWLLVHWLPGAPAAVFGLALEDTLPTAPTATAPTIVKATSTLDNLFILLMTSVSSRANSRSRPEPRDGRGRRRRRACARGHAAHGTHRDSADHRESDEHARQSLHPAHDLCLLSGQPPKKASSQRRRK